MPGVVGTLPETHTAIIQTGNGETKITEGLSLPRIEPFHLLVKTMAVALNPCDFKMPARFPTLGCYNGCDFAGIVVAIGSEAAEKGSFAIGDRVFAAVNGNNPRDKDTGAYAEYLKSEYVFTWKIPDAMTFEEAAGLSGTIIATNGVSLFQSLALPGTFDEPAKKAVDVLVYGGSSSVGTMAIQMVKLLGHRAITTCSSKNTDLVKAYGADAVFDHNLETCGQDIKKHTKNNLKYILDPYAEIKTMQVCFDAMGRAGGRYTALEKSPHEEMFQKKLVKRDLVMGAAIHGKGLALAEGYEKPPDVELRAWGIEWYKSVQRLVDQGKLRPHPIRQLPGRFDGIVNGINMLKAREVSGEKLVVSLS